MIDVGDSLLAYDVAKVGLKKFPEDRTLSQKAASALINAGSPLKATHILEELVAVGDRDVEAHSLLASAYKDLWQYASDPESKKRYAELAIARYKEGFSTTSFDAFKQSRVKDVGTEYYPCINVAFMYLLSGDAEEARSYSTRALEICRNLKLNSLGDYWSQATTGEAYLIEGELDASLEAYAEAVAMPDAEPAKIATTRTQAIQIASAYEDPMVLEQITGVFPQTGIIACSGHVIDKKGGSIRFPSEAEALAKVEIEAALDKLDCSYGFSSAACGTDILFIEAMLARGGEVHVFLPFNKKDFIETSVRRAGGNWVQRFERALDKAQYVHYVTEEEYLGDDTLFELCNDVLVGFAAMRAHTLDEDPKLLVLWNGEGGSTGGTGQLVTRWSKRFGPPEIIDSTQMLASASIESTPVRKSGETQPAFLVAASRTAETGPVRLVKTMLFADVQGFSKLPDSDSPVYVEQFLGGLASLLDKQSRRPAFINTWGDAIFCVFDEVEDGLAFALDLRDFVSQTDWSEKGLPFDFDIRIALHAGPAYAAHDPLLRRTNFFGSHVNKAARIEPIALPGCVYVSETVAGLLSFGHDDFDFEYVGNIELAKGFGSFPIYLLQRSGYIDY
ncbi:MAG: hypothetical protein HN494_06265 [Opitutae bacterium]|nr:hypothetical protein [Opitutae bacterium]